MKLPAAGDASPHGDTVSVPNLSSKLNQTFQQTPCGSVQISIEKLLGLS